MKITGFLKVRNEMLKGNLLRCLGNMRQFCDAVVAYDDGSTDDSRFYLEKYLGCENVIGVSFLERSLKRNYDVLGTLDGTTAFFTDEVMVMTIFSMMIDHMVVYFTLIDAAGFFQDIQSPVNGRLIHAGHTFLDVLDDVFGGNVLCIVMNEVDYHPSLRCDSHPF